MKFPKGVKMFFNKFNKLNKRRYEKKVLKNQFLKNPPNFRCLKNKAPAELRPKNF